MTLKTTIISLILVHYGLLFSQFKDLQFEHLAIEDGLSNNTVQCILQDQQGFMWFGTSDGLNRWDGYTFKIFTHSPNDSTSISNNYITALCEDSSGIIWIGTGFGLNTFDPSTEKITHYFSIENDTNSVSNNYPSVVFKDSQHNIWIGTAHGLNRYNYEKNTFTRFFFPGQLDSVSQAWDNNTISAISEDKEGMLLLGTMNDFLLFDTGTGDFSVIPDVIPVRKHWPLVPAIYKDQSGSIWITVANVGITRYDSYKNTTQFYRSDMKNSSNFHIGFVPTSFCEDENNNLWVGTANHGLYIFDRRSGGFNPYQITGKDENKIISNAITCLYKDMQGNIWVGTADKGIQMNPKWRKPFKFYVHDPQNYNNLAAGEVTHFYEDKQGLIWISHFSGNISLFDKNRGVFTYIRHDPKDKASLTEGSLYGVREDSYGYIWFATAPALTRMERKTGQFKYFQHDLSNPKSHAYTHTLCCFEDQQENMWFGTANAGLERFNRASGTFDHFKFDPADSNSIPSNAIFTLYQDKTGIFWIGTSHGFSQLTYDRAGKEKFIRYRQHPVNQPSHNGNTISAFLEDRLGRLWIATDSGLELFDREKNSSQLILHLDEFPGEYIWGIIEDDQGMSEGKAGNLWLRTGRAIVRFTPETGKLRVYDEGDGLKYCKSIKSGFAAFYKARNGEIYSGGINSITIFHPDSLEDNPDPPPIVLTGVKINYQTVRIGNQSPLMESIVIADTLRLNYNQNIISFEFTALDYTAPAKNHYAYKLGGVNPDWIYTDASRRFASYTNLDPGKYTFRVKGSNNDGVWNETGVSLQIIITPPWWHTRWAYTFYIVFFCAALIATWRLQLRRIQIRNELKMKNFETQKLQEIDQLKSRFFANISHEFRTPLTLILGPISQMLANTRRIDFRENLSIMKRNALRLQRLINQLLDLSKLEAGHMRLQVHHDNIVTLLRSFVQAFESRARMKNIQLQFSASRDDIPGYIDREKLETIINNLLSNAFKFTPEGGIVSVIVYTPPLSPFMYKGGNKWGSEEFLQISISDTGCGIPPDRLPHIFDRFYRANNSYDQDQEGTGIGLALTKELVEFHRGDISVSSEVGKGTTFVIQLPIGKAAYQDEDTGDIPSPLFPSLPGGEDKGGWEDIQIETSPRKTTSSKKSLPNLLVVEDNADMRRYIRNTLGNDFRIHEAEDGEEGYKKCIRLIPDLVISDVMMPGMDGFQLCAKLKQDERSSHIPVILLTARAAVEDRIGGLESGADDYLIKPFDARELQVRVRNLIAQRRKLRERFRKEGILQPQQLATTSTDQKFLQKALEIVELNLSDEDFTVVSLGKEIGMSRTLLYRKLLALTDHSPNEFIRHIRLNHAARLLATRSGNVSQIAFRVGFNNLSYFTKCFQRQFGISPSRYATVKSSM